MLTSGVTLSTPSRCLQSKNYSRVPHMRPSYDKEPGRRSTGRSTTPTMKRSWFSWCSHLFLCHVFSPKLIQWVHEPSRSWRLRSCHGQNRIYVVWSSIPEGESCNQSGLINISIHGLMTIPNITYGSEKEGFARNIWSLTNREHFSPFWTIGNMFFKNITGGFCLPKISDCHKWQCHVSFVWHFQPKIDG